MALALAAAATDALAQEDGDFTIESASTHLRDGVYYLDASVNLELSSDAKQALLSGLSLTIRYEVEFLRRLRLWWDNEAHTLRQRYRLQYHPLTRRYIVLNVNTDVQTSYANLDDALRRVARVESWPLIDTTLLDFSRGYDVRMRVVLDTERLPGPLRLLAFWRRDWSLGSGWYRWQLSEQ